MNGIMKYVYFLPDIPKTIVFNFRYFGIKGLLKMPFKVSRKVKFLNLKGRIELGSMRRAMVELGYSDVGIIDKKYSRTIWDVSGEVRFIGNAKIGYGSKISVGRKGFLEFGNDFVITASSSVVCNRSVIFGNNCLLSWDILVIDDDFHTIIHEDGSSVNSDGVIKIGNNNWIGCRTLILKGISTGNNCVIGAGSLINKSIEDNNCLIAGVPARKIKNISGWDIQNSLSMNKE